MSGLVDRDSFQYSDDAKRAFVEKFFELGTLTQACEVTGLNYETAKSWKKKDWFQVQLAEMKAEHSERLQDRIAKNIELALKEQEDRIVNGNERLDKNGKIVRVKAGLHELSVAIGVGVEKRELLKNAQKPTANEDILGALADQLRRFVNPKQVIDVEVIEVETED